MKGLQVGLRMWMEELGGHRSRQGGRGEGTVQCSFHRASERRLDSPASAATRSLSSPSHSFSSDCSRYSSAQRARGPGDKGSARSREVGSQQGAGRGEYEPSQGRIPHRHPGQKKTLPSFQYPTYLPQGPGGQMY